MKMIAAAFATVVLSCAILPEAKAVGLLEKQSTNAVGNCQAALPAYEGVVRKRPLAIVNEGTTAAFVTCAFTTNMLSLGISAHQSRISNYSSTAQTVSCTSVTGVDGSAKYVAKSGSMSPNSSSFMSYSALLDNLNILFVPRLSVSCLLPPGTGINYGEVTSVLSLL